MQLHWIAVLRNLLQIVVILHSIFGSLEISNIRLGWKLRCILSFHITVSDPFKIPLHFWALGLFLEPSLGHQFNSVQDWHVPLLVPGGPSMLLLTPQQSSTSSTKGCAPLHKHSKTLHEAKCFILPSEKSGAGVHLFVGRLLWVNRKMTVLIHSLCLGILQDLGMGVLKTECINEGNPKFSHSAASWIAEVESLTRTFA